jgi:hypothetical protein
MGNYTIGKIVIKLRTDVTPKTETLPNASTLPKVLTLPKAPTLSKALTIPKAPKTCRNRIPNVKTL